jgi:hypothetical protein
MINFTSYDLMSYLLFFVCEASQPIKSLSRDREGRGRFFSSLMIDSTLPVLAHVPSPQRDRHYYYFYHPNHCHNPTLS